MQRRDSRKKTVLTIVLVGFCFISAPDNSNSSWLAAQLEHFFSFIEQIFVLVHADLNLNKNTTLILSGSSSIDIHRETERLPGRRGIEKPDRCLFPLNFRDFFHLRSEKLTEPLDLKNLYADIGKKIPTLRLLGRNLQRCFLEYIRIGGFFPAITDFLNVQKIKPLTFESYTDVFLSDLKKVGRDRIIIRDISQKILTLLSSHLSWNNIARQAGNISPITARSYINTLADAFSIYILEFFDRNKSTHNPNKNKKIYPFDPIFYTVMNYLGGRGDFMNGGMTGEKQGHSERSLHVIPANAGISEIPALRPE